jgi:subtilisin family serine protease
MFATPDNNLGLASPLTQFWPGIKLMPVKFFGADTRPTPARAKQAIEYAVANGAQVINASWHVGPGQNGVAPVRLAVEAARLAGVLVVTAAGNDGSNNDKYPTYPANFSQTHTNVLSVHATNTRDYKPSFSNYGRNTVHLGAPGVRITTTARYLSKRPIYRSISGTSAAAAFTSLAAAMVIAIDKHRNPLRTLTPQQVINHLRTTADSVRQLSACSMTGRRLNLANAVKTPVP